MSEEQRPEAKPSEAQLPPPSGEREIILREPRMVGFGRSVGWIAEAFYMYFRYPTPWLITGLILFGLSLFTAFIPVAGGALSVIVSSLVAGGVVMGCAAQELGEPYSADYVFVGFRRPQKLILLALVHISLLYGILFATLGDFGFAIFVGGIDPQTLEQQLQLHRSSILLSVVLLIPLIMAKWFAVVLIVLHDLTVAAAMKLSFFACLRNLFTMFVFSWALGILFLIGSLAFFVGLLVMYPVLTISSYTAYRDIFTHEQVGVK